MLLYYSNIVPSDVSYVLLFSELRFKIIPKNSELVFKPRKILESLQKFRKNPTDI